MTDATRITAVSAESPVAGAYPTLEPAQVDVLLTWGQERDTEPGEILVRAGEPLEHLFVVLEGRIDVVQASGGSNETFVTAFGSRQFAGSKSLLTGQSLQVTDRIPVADGRG